MGEHRESGNATSQVERSIERISYELTIPVLEHIILGNGWQVLFEDVDQSALANVYFSTCKFGQRLGADFRDRIGRFIAVIHLNTSLG